MKPAALLTSALALGLLVPITQAHFKLLEPPSAMVEANNGDPQKLGPCGGTTADPGKPSNIVTPMVGGQKLHIKLQETVFHPGHYRVALAVNGKEELPNDANVVTRDTEKGPRSISSAVAALKIPVLADGLWTHDSKLADNTLETDVTLPNITCARCTLQITQFMAEHGYNKDGGYFYHHCADLAITADASKPVTPGWPKAK